MDKKEQILEAALELLVVNGIHASPMSAIAKAAGTGMGTIYNYFSTKEILINSIYVHIKQKEKNVFEHLMISGRTKEQLKEYYNTLIEFFSENKRYFDFFEQLTNSPIISKESEEEGMKTIIPVIEILRLGQKDKTIKLVNIEELLQFMSGVIIAHLRWLFKQEKTAYAVDSNNYFNMLWDGIKI